MMTQTTESLHQTFQTSDSALDVEAMVRWLDRVDAHPPTAQLKQSMLELCPVAAGDRVLDVGCGVGHEVLRLAERVGPAGRVVGIDPSAPMIAQARRRAADRPLPVEYEIGDAHELAFPEEVFDLCRTERVLRYLHQGRKRRCARWPAWSAAEAGCWRRTSTQTRPSSTPPISR